MIFGVNENKILRNYTLKPSEIMKVNLKYIQIYEFTKNIYLVKERSDLRFKKTSLMPPTPAHVVGHLSICLKYLFV